MAIIKIGPPLSGIRGTIGGITFSANGSGTYAKLWAPPVNPRSPNQATQRAYVSRMPELWRDMTDAQRAAWDTFAALGAQELTNSLGEAYYASGLNWFVKCNVRLLRVGRTPLVPVPTQARPAAPTIDDFRVCVAGSESDLCICGAATASTETVGFEASKAFDNNTVTQWKTLAPNPTGWIQYAFCANQNIKHLAVWPRAAAAWATNPKDFTFQVNSGGWQTLLTVTNMLWVADEFNHFYFPNTYDETDYRINITANHGDPNNVIIKEIQMFAGDEGASVICYPEDEFEDTPDYDLILHVSMGPTIGRQVQYPGYLEILALQSPGRWFELFQTEILDVFGTISDQRSWFAQLARQTTQGIRSAWQTDRTITIGA